MITDPFIISLDTDWAPDFVLADVMSIFEKFQVKSTWFITNESPSLERLKNSPLFEIGIHPNFMEKSSHGGTTVEVLNHMNGLVEDAVSNRMHGLVESWQILTGLVEETQVSIDSSIFLPLMDGNKAVDLLIAGKKLRRIPFIWGDDYELTNAILGWKPDRLMHLKGLRIINFHPIHIYLNSSSISSYNEIKESLDKSLNEVEEHELSKYFNSSTKGAKDFLEELLIWIKHEQGDSLFIKELLD